MTLMGKIDKRGQLEMTVLKNLVEERSKRVCAWNKDIASQVFPSKFETLN